MLEKYGKSYVNVYVNIPLFVGIYYIIILYIYIYNVRAKEHTNTPCTTGTHGNKHKETGREHEHTNTIHNEDQTLLITSSQNCTKAPKMCKNQIFICVRAQWHETVRGI